MSISDPSGASSSSKVEPTAAMKHQQEHLRTEFWLGVVLIVLFAALELFLGHLAWAEALKTDASRWLQAHLMAPKTSERLAVSIVDIQSLKPQRAKATLTNSITGKPSQQEIELTPRKTLENLIRVIASASPAAIGIDIDMSMEPELTPSAPLARDTALLMNTALKVAQSGIPVFFGVKRNESLPPAQWLGDPKYSSLAADLSRDEENVAKIPLSFQFPDHTLPSLSGALASVPTTSLSLITESPPKFLQWISKPLSVETPLRTVPAFKVVEYLVDYSHLDRLISERVDFSMVMKTSPKKLEDSFRGQIVLIGDATPDQTLDTVSIPGRIGQVPGVYVHACGVQTLLRAPLWEIEPWASILATILFSLMALSLVYFICSRFVSKYEVSMVPLTILLDFSLIVALLLGAWCLARWTHVIWFEVFVVCLFLLVHCLLEVFLGSIDHHRLKQGIGHLIASLVVKPKEPQQ